MTAAAPAKVQLRKLVDLKRDPDNARTHSAEQTGKVADSIRRFGWTMPMLVDDVIRAGNCRADAAAIIYGAGEAIYMAPGKDRGGAKLPPGTVPVIDCTGWSPEERTAYAITDNQLPMQAGWDEGRLRDQLQALASMDFSMSVLGFDEKELERLTKPPPAPVGLGNMAGEFLVAPFSTLNARDGWWQDRKRTWIGLGIKSELGRGEQAAIGGAPLPLDRDKARTFGQDLMRGEGTNVLPGNTAPTAADLQDGSGTSIFDPVLCELIYLWFSGAGQLVLDPFAGGSVRGIVAAALGRRYLGVDLRPEQVAANELQWPIVAGQLAAELPEPEWLAGDSVVVMPQLEVEADLIFSCPPYGDLEIYSDDPADLSRLDQEKFEAAYAHIIGAAVARLKPDRFACFVVGDYRDKRGFYRDFVSTTIAAFHAAGAILYNEAILITAVGSLAIRTGKQFRASRKMGKTHQNVLIFCKGDPRKASAACGAVDVSAALAAVEG